MQARDVADKIPTPMTEEKSTSLYISLFPKKLYAVETVGKNEKKKVMKASASESFCSFILFEWF